MDYLEGNNNCFNPHGLHMVIIVNEMYCPATWNQPIWLVMWHILLLHTGWIHPTNPTMHQTNIPPCITLYQKRVHISVTKCCIVGYEIDTWWDFEMYLLFCSDCFLWWWHDRVNVSVDFWSGNDNANICVFSLCWSRDLSLLPPATHWLYISPSFVPEDQLLIKSNNAYMTHIFK